MNQPVTISAVVTTDLKRLLEEWAMQEDRTVSATLRQILPQEASRRQQRQQQQKTAKQ